MKSKKSLILVSILILAIFTAVPVSAKKTQFSYKASGTIDSYVDVWSSEIVSGHWSVNVKGDSLRYNAMFRELNLAEWPEDSPVGSVDIFTHKFTADGFVVDGDTLVFWGTMHVKKVWVKPDWTTEVVRWDSYVTITITPDSFYLDSNPPGSGPGQWDQDWDRIGTTTHFKREGEPEISIYYSGSITYIIYNLHDPDNLGYHFTAWVNVYSSDGVGDIASVTMITPEGDPVEMYYGGPAEEPGFSKYYADLDLDGPMLGFYGFAAEDGDGNTAEFEYEVSTWIDSIPTYVAPPVGEVFTSSDSLQWVVTFDSEAPSFDGYWLELRGDSGFFWMIETPDMPIDFIGELLEDGDYGWSLYCMTPDLEAEVLIQGSFVIDSGASP